MAKKRGSKNELQKEESSDSSEGSEELDGDYEEYEEEEVEEDDDSGEYEYEEEEDESLEDEDEEDDEMQGSDFGGSFRNENEQSYSGGFDQSFSLHRSVRSHQVQFW